VFTIGASLRSGCNARQEDYTASPLSSQAATFDAISTHCTADAQGSVGPCPATGKAISCPGRTTSYIATLVERHTRYVMLAKVAGKDTQTVVSALIKQAKKLPTELYKS